METKNNFTSIYGNKKRIKIKEMPFYILIYAAVFLTLSILGSIMAYIFINGIPNINFDFISSDYDPKTSFVSLDLIMIDKDYVDSINVNFADEGEILVDENNHIFEYLSTKVVNIDSRGKKTLKDIKYKIKKGDRIKSIGKTNKFNLLSSEEAKDRFKAALYEAISKNEKTLKIKMFNPGGGIFPMLITTFYMILLSLFISIPIGIFSAIYLVEYAKAGRLVNIIRFGIESLAGIPSIIYGLFGMIFFVTSLNIGYSLLAGSLTVSIILLPVIIRQTEESLKTVPMSYRESSLGLGATKLQTIVKVVIPAAFPGIIIAVILSVGRVVGESAALLLTAGTAARIPKTLFESGATLTIKAYQLAQDEGNYQLACAIGTIIIALVLIINFSAKAISKKFMRR